MLRPSLAVGVSLVGLSLTAPVRAADLAEVRRAQRLEVTVAAASAFEKDILTGFARALGVELHVVSANTPEAALGALAEGKADLACGGFISEMLRNDRVVASSEVFPNRMLIVNRKPAEPIQFIEQLRNERTAAAKDTPAPDVLSGAKVPRVDASMSTVKVLGALSSGSITAGAVPLFDALHARTEDAGLQLGVYLGPRLSVAFALRSADSGLLKALNAHLATVRASSSFRLLVSRHFGDATLQELARAKLNEPR